MCQQALLIAGAHHLPAVYDAHYIALAQLLHYDLWTDGCRPLRALGGRLAFVRWIGDYTPSQLVWRRKRGDSYATAFRYVTEASSLTL